MSTPTPPRLLDDSRSTSGDDPQNAARVRTKPPTPALALSVEQACAALGIGWDTWREHVEHEVRIVRLGRRKLVPVVELERWLADHAESALERR